MSTYLPGSAQRFSTSPQAGFNPLGTTGLWCHPLGFGCYRVAEDVPTHEAAMRRYFEKGGNLLDTSANYTDGGAERTIGRVLPDFKREDVIVVTKGGYIQGENMALAQKQTFPEVVKYGPGLWHCIHPDFLKTQIERSRNRMQLETIDVFLLHNPEYFINYRAKHGLTEADRTEFYRRVRLAFEYLESEVQAGRIGCYGISSNNYPLPLSDPTHTSIARCLEQAQAVASNHHFNVVQFPFNLFERGVALNHSNDGLTPLEYCRREGLGTLANRPLNAFSGNALIRLADFVKPGTPVPGPAQLAVLLQPLKSLEMKLSKEHRMALMGRNGMADHIASIVAQVNSTDMWEQVAGRYVISPIRNWLAETGEKMEHQAAAFDRWQDEFVALINPLLAHIGDFVAARQQPQSDHIRERLFQAGYPAQTSHSLSQMALAVLGNTPGLSCSLLGMRRPAYVDDAMSVPGFPAFDGLALLQGLRTEDCNED
ncbi:MAG: aldo/keto reductase [Blastocatellia bacterium]|nr:aldo/keto reductase [Blastocatellia bacterium]